MLLGGRADMHVDGLARGDRSCRKPDRDVTGRFCECIALSVVSSVMRAVVELDEHDNFAGGRVFKDKVDPFAREAVADRRGFGSGEFASRLQDCSH